MGRPSNLSIDAPGPTRGVHGRGQLLATLRGAERQHRWGVFLVRLQAEVGEEIATRIAPSTRRVAERRFGWPGRGEVLSLRSQGWLPRGYRVGWTSQEVGEHVGVVLGDSPRCIESVGTYGCLTRSRRLEARELPVGIFELALARLRLDPFHPRRCGLVFDFRARLIDGAELRSTSGATRCIEVFGAGPLPPLHLVVAPGPGLGGTMPIGRAGGWGWRSGCSDTRSHGRRHE